VLSRLFAATHASSMHDDAKMSSLHRIDFADIRYTLLMGPNESFPRAGRRVAWMRSAVSFGLESRPVNRFRQPYC
jgi:hypothetical protein